MFTDAEYREARERLDVLFDLPTLSQAEGSELYLLATRIEEYEKVNYPMGQPTPAAAAAFRADQERTTPEQTAQERTRPLAADERTLDEFECPVCGSCGEVGCGCTEKCKPEDPRCLYRDYIARQRAAGWVAGGAPPGLEPAEEDSDAPMMMDHPYVGSETEDACLYQPSVDSERPSLDATAVRCNRPRGRHPQKEA